MQKIKKIYFKMITFFSFSNCDRKSFFVFLLSFLFLLNSYGDTVPVNIVLPGHDEFINGPAIREVPCTVTLTIPAFVYVKFGIHDRPGTQTTEVVTMQLTDARNVGRYISANGYSHPDLSVTGSIIYPTDDPNGGGDSGGGDSGGGDSGGGDSGGGDSGGGDSGGGSGGAYALESSMQTLLTIIRNTTNDYLYRVLGTNESIESKLSGFISSFPSNVLTSFSTLNNTSSSIKTTVESISGKVSTIQSDVGTIREKVSTIKDDVSSVKSDISKIEKNTLDTKNLLSDIKGKFTGNLPSSPSRVSTINPHSNAWDTIKHKLLPSYNFFRNVGSNNMQFNFIFETTNFGLQSFNVPITFPWDQLPSNFSDPDRGSLRTFLTFFRKLLLVLMAWCFLKVVLKTLRQW